MSELFVDGAVCYHDGRQSNKRNAPSTPEASDATHATIFYSDSAPAKNKEVSETACQRYVIIGGYEYG